MREIKFRAWGRYGEWEEDGENQKYQMLYGDALAFEEYAPINELLGSVEHLMQYTGLKDKNGKEIYEGDIISMPYYNYSQNWRVEGLSAYGLFFERITGKPYAAPYHWKDMRHRDKIEVIGNIYENPDLWEVKQS